MAGIVPQTGGQWLHGSSPGWSRAVGSLKSRGVLPRAAEIQELCSPPKPASQGLVSSTLTCCASGAPRGWGQQQCCGKVSFFLFSFSSIPRCDDFLLSLGVPDWTRMREALCANVYECAYVHVHVCMYANIYICVY